MKEWIGKTTLAVIAVLVLAALTEAYQDIVDRRRLDAVCGEWITIMPRGKLVIREQNGYYMMTSYRLSPRGRVEVSQHRLQGGRSLHYGRGKNKTYIYLTEDGKTLQLVPGNCYKRKEFSTSKTKDDEE